MTDLYQINEIMQAELDDKQKTPHPNSGYSSDTNYLSTVNLFIKAIQKALEHVNKAVAIIDLKNEKSNPELMTEFFDNLKLAKEIVEEFQKGTAILYDDKPELIELFNQLHEAFSIIKLKINLFSIKKDKKHADDSIHHFNSVLGVFQNMKAMTQEYLKTDSKAPQTEPGNTA